MVGLWSRPFEDAAWAKKRFGHVGPGRADHQLSQTAKLARRIPVVLYGPGYWKEVINFDALLHHGMISSEDLALFRYADDPASALEILKAGLVPEPDDKAPAFAHSRTARHQDG